MSVPIMARGIEINTEWKEADDGLFCIVTALNHHTRRILLSIRVNVPVRTEMDFTAQYGKTLKEEVEIAAIEIAKNIAARAPE